MHFEDLVQFLERDMRMSHVYQPVMLRLLLGRNGRASVQDVARALLNEDRSQLEYYSEITKNMVGRVLANRAVVKREGGDYELLGYDRLTAEQVQELKAICDRKPEVRRKWARCCLKSVSSRSLFIALQR